MCAWGVWLKLVTALTINWSNTSSWAKNRQLMGDGTLGGRLLLQADWGAVSFEL
jgi:hypothetical protein